MKKLSATSPIAFFCTEYALQSDIPTYAGGLGVLAGDVLLEASKENIPFLLVSLRYGGIDVSKNGYKQVTDENGEPIRLQFFVGNKKIYACAWMAEFGSGKILLIDSDIPENNAEARGLCARLYDDFFYARISQQMILGLGGIAMLEAMKIEPAVYHLNEGHTGIVAMGIIVREMKKGLSFEDAVSSVREKTIGTKHTIFTGAGTYIPLGEFMNFFGDYFDENGVPLPKIFEIGQYEMNRDMFSTTKFMLQMSVRHNAVSRLHMEEERIVHPGSTLTYITNGIFEDRWRVSALAEEKEISGPKKILMLKKQARETMISFVRSQTGTILDPNMCTVVWSRRLAAYKRPELLFSDTERLKKICASGKVQFVFAGKAHSADEWGQKISRMLHDASVNPDFCGRIAYIPDYNLDIAHVLASGADVWLNTPERGKEACGTSGMKAGLNGTLMCSISDGWMDEVDWKGIGWIIPEEKSAEAIYDVLEKEIIPEFYADDGKKDSGSWFKRMKATSDIVSSKYTTKRMLKEYFEKMYFLQDSI